MLFSAISKRVVRTVPLLAVLGTLTTLCATAGVPDLGIGANLNGKQVFPVDNPWNQRVDTAPVDPGSDTFINNIGRTIHLHPDFGSDTTYGIPYIIVPGSTAGVPVTFDYVADSDPGPYPIPSNAPIEGGPSSTGDRHVLVIDRDNWKLYEMWNANMLSDGSWHAGSGAIFDLNSNSLRPDGLGSADAAGLPIFPGLVRFEEVQSGAINHAIRFTVVNTRRAYVYPARHYASSNTDPSFPPMGMRVRLKASFDISTFPADARVILQAMKTYGLILADNGGNWFFSGASDSRWNDTNMNTLKTLTGDNFEVVKMGPVTTPNSPAVTSAQTGGGTVGSAFSYQITASGSPTSYGATGLPSGLTVNSANGVISGTPTVAGVSTAVVTATNSVGTGSNPLTLTINPGAVESPYGGTAWTIPGKIEAENYDLGGQGLAYNDTTAGNTGGVYRTDNVDIRAVANDAGGGYQVGWTATGEWLKYTVNVASTGNYDFQVREATGGSAGTIHIEVDGVNATGAMTLPVTGSWDTFTTVTKTSVSLTSGRHILRVYQDVGGPDLNWINVVASPITTTPFNVNAIFTTGTAVTNGGADSYGDAYQADQFGTSATFNGSTFTFGPANALDAWSNVTVNLPAGSYTTLNMVGSAVGGNVTGKVFTVNYIDGTTSVFTIGLHDWENTGLNAGEVKVTTMVDHLNVSGASVTPGTFLHGYTFTLTGHAVRSITLPATRQVIAFGFAGR